MFEVRIFLSVHCLFNDRNLLYKIVLARIDRVRMSVCMVLCVCVCEFIENRILCVRVAVRYRRFMQQEALLKSGCCETQVCFSRYK